MRARLAVAESLRGAGPAGTAGFARATGPRDFSFPADHGPHPDFRIEWWYFTGNLATADGRRFGYQLTVFRRALAPPGAADERGSDWATRQAYMAHLALTDVGGRRFRAFERTARGAAGLAGARARPFRVWVGSWRATGPQAPGGQAPGAAGGVFPMHLAAAQADVAIDLELATAKPPVLQGDRGLSRKGPGPGDASYAYSLTRLPTRGAVTVGGRRFAVSGTSWLDREWSTSLLGPGETGWDWFALQLDDDREVVAWRIRGRGAPDRLDELALVEPDGALRRLETAGARLRATRAWTSPAGERVPVGWRLSAPEAGLDLAVAALLDDQELDLSFRYWEGAVAVRGRLGDRPVTGRGYAEVTGYGGG